MNHLYESPTEAHGLVGLEVVDPVGLQDEADAALLSVFGGGHPTRSRGSRHIEAVAVGHVKVVAPWKFEGEVFLNGGLAVPQHDHLGPAVQVFSGVVRGVASQVVVLGSAGGESEET